MPFQNVSDLPPRIKSQFGAEGQRAFLGAFNSAFDGTCKDDPNREGCAFGVATAAAKKAEKSIHGPGDDKRRKKFAADVRVFKADHERQIMFGVVLEPEFEDTQGDVITAEDVELAAHRFAAAYALGKAQLGLDHEVLMDRDDAVLVETYIAPVEFESGGMTIRKGAWVIGVHIPDVALWKSVQEAERTGFSIGGSGVREAA